MHLLYPKTKTFFLFIFFLWLSMAYPQKTYNDSINIYFGQIKDLLKKSNDNKEDFLDIEFLLDKQNRVNGNEKVYVLLKLYSAYVYKSLEDARSYNHKALELSKNIGYVKGELAAKFNEAYLLFVNGQFDEAMLLAENVSKKATFDNYPEVHADTHALISYIHTERGEYDMALETGLRLLDIAEKSQDEYLFMRASSALSHYYLRMENYRMALSYCLKGLHYVIRLKKVQFIFPKIDEIGRMTAKLNSAEKALEIYSFYLDVEKKIASPGSYIQSIVYMNIADIYISINQYEKAQEYLTQAMELNYQNNYRFRIPRALILQAELFLKTSDTINALLYYEKSIDAAEDINAFDVVKTSSATLADLYEKNNQLSKAYEYSTLNKAIRDSLFSNEKEQKIIILETRRKIKEVTQKQKILELENETQKARYNTMVIVLVFILIIGSFGTYSYFKVRNKNRLLYRKTIELAQVQVDMRQKLQQLEIKDTEIHEIDPSEDDHRLKTSKTLDDTITDIILKRLTKLEQEHFFLDHSCSLREVALQLKTNPKYLSQVVNQEKRMSFSNYINELRINYLLERLLEDPDFRHNKLSYIATSVGYNNLNTFNTAFKKRQGILPSFFINELIQESKPKKV
ncbi:MAG: helix-turn-helix domain-containing protein [Algicola sp.]|nr:helix-turn-helix domain-containing protein [Algicola sp.]